MRDELLECGYFSFLDTGSLEKLSSATTLKRYEKGGVIFFCGEVSDFIHIVYTGAIRIYRARSDGGEITVGIFRPFSFFGEFANFKNIPFPSNAEALIDSLVLRIEYRTFREMFFDDTIRKNPVFVSLFEKFGVLNTLVDRGMVLNIKERVAKFILQNHDLFGKLQHYHIASMLKVTPETLSRTLKKLENEGLIVNHGKKGIEVVDKEGLFTLI